MGAVEGERIGGQRCEQDVARLGKSRGRLVGREPEEAQLDRDPAVMPLLGVSRHVVVADSDREAFALAERAYPQWRASLLHLWERHGMTAPFIGYPPSAREAIEQDFLYAGSAATVRTRVEQLERETGIGYLLCRFAFGELPQDATRHSVALFTGEVMPALG